MSHFRWPIGRFALGLFVVVPLAGGACTSFGSVDEPSADAAPNPTPTATGLVEASAADGASDALADTRLPDANNGRRVCTGTPFATFESAQQEPALINLTKVGSVSFVPAAGFVGYPMTAQINPMVRGTSGLKGMSNATVPATSRFCFEMWAQVNAAAADAGGEVVIVQLGLGGAEAIRIDFAAGGRFVGGVQAAPFFVPSTTEPHHWVVRVFPFAGRHKAELSIDGVPAVAFTSPTLLGNQPTFLSLGASTDSATTALVTGAKVVVGEAYATLEN